MNIIETCGDWIERKQLIRRLVLLWSICLTTAVVLWGLDFAAESTRPGMEVAAIIGAVFMPISLLQNWALGMYNSARTGQ